MGDPTIVKGGTPNFVTSSSTTLTFYNTQSESFRKSANLITFNLPASDSDNAIAFDLLGTTRQVTIRGTFVVSGGNLSINNFTSDLNSLIKGNQGNTGGSQTGYNYSASSISETMRVYVNDVNWDFKAGEPSSLEYTVVLVQISGAASG